MLSPHVKKVKELGSFPKREETLQVDPSRRGAGGPLTQK